MATKSTSKDDGRNQVAEFNSQWRDGEQALLRLNRNTAERGDGIRLAKVGLNDPNRQKTELERLLAVEVQQVKAGTSRQFRDARDTFHEAVPRCGAGLAHCDSELERLDQERAAVVLERNQQQAELTNATNALSVMESARERLQSPNLLPPHVVAELDARRNAVANESGERRRQLAELIATLTADAGRLDSQTDSFGKLENEWMLEQFATRAAGKATHRGFAFWEDRVFSLREWRNYQSWAAARAVEYQTELDSLKFSAAAGLADEVEELSGFYVSAIE